MILRPLVRWCAITIMSGFSAGLAGCGSSPKGESTPPAATTTGADATTGGATSSLPMAPTTATAPEPVKTAGILSALAIPGSWTSPKCGARGYVRNLELGLDHRFKAEDRVSPCPPNVACVWSGIVNREGTWTHDAGKVTLATDEVPNPPKQGADLPGSLEFPGAELVEVQGSERCSYTRP